MFAPTKPAFGQTSGTFGFNTTTSPFGQSAFGKPATTGFGSGAFGAAQPQPGQSTGLFGQPQPAQPTGLFGQPAQPTNAFGAPSTQSSFGFGQNQPSGGLFSSPTNTGSSLFGQPAAQPFGAKPQGFGFGATSSGNTLFGSTAAPSTGLFGQTATPTAGTSGLFGATPGFGGQQQTGTYIKYAPFSGTDVLVKNGHSQSISTLHHCITCMKEYEAKSLEELRLEDYGANRKGGPTGMGGGAMGPPPPTGSVFGQAQPQGGLFGQTTNTFGQNNSAFGQPSTSSTGLFGKPATTGFGAQPATGSGFTFGAATSNQSTLFGAAKPFSSSLFGAPATQAQATPFSSQPSQGFGTMGAPQQSTGLFGAKPPENTFGLGQNNQQAPAFGTGNVFGAPTASTASTGMFGAKPGATPFGSTAPAFGTTNTAFGSTNSAFGAPTSNTGGSLFGNAFGAKPATTGAPSFGAFATPTTNTGLGTGLNFGGGSLFGQKPPGTGLFGSTGTAPQPGSLFGAPNTGLQMGGGGLATGTNTFGSGNVGFQSSGLGSTGLNTGGLGAGTGLTGFNNNLLGGTVQSPPGGSIHEQMIALASKPFGHSPLFKDLVPSTDKTDDSLRPTNPIAQKAILDSDKYKVSPGVPRLRVKPFSGATPLSKKSLFDGLEENDPSVQESFTAKRNVKRLVLRPKPSDNSLTNTSLPAIEGPENHSINEGDQSADIRSEEASRVEQLNKDSTTPTSSNIQKRVGFESRGSTSKSPLQGSSNVNSSEDSERRSSWLTTKPLNKWSSPESISDGQSGPSTAMMGGIIGSSATPTTSVVSQLDSTIDQLLPGRSQGGGRLYPSLKKPGLIGDVETLEDDTQEERDKENTVPHPTGIRLTRPGYYTIPSMDELVEYLRSDGTCIVPQFTVGRRGYGNVFFDCEMDVANLDLDEIVHIMNKEIIVYPEDDNKPEVGKGLNRKAQVTLDKVWPKDKTFMVPITDPERLALMDYEAKLRRACDKIGTKFIEYRPQTGSWVFKVQHFSKYGLTESDEEDDGPVDISKLKQQQLALQQLQQSKGILNVKAGGVMVGGGKVGRGLGGEPMPVSVGLGGGSLSYDDEHSLDDQLFTARTSAINKGLAMDTSEENSVDTVVFYPDGNQSESKDVLSPMSRSHLNARNSHTLQLMKASFYNTDSDDAASVTDQLVPQIASTAGSVSNMSLRLDTGTHSQRMDTTLLPQDDVRHEPIVHSGIEMKGPIIKPQTVMLKYHKRILPFRKTIAGRMGAASYTDLSIANARLFRVGWGRGTQFTCLTTLDSTTDSPLSGGLPTLGEYVRGRDENDGSAVITQRLRIAGGGTPTDMGLTFKESIEPHLEIVLQNSKLIYPNEGSPDDCCPLIVPDPDRCLSAAKQHLQEDTKLAARETSLNFGVNASYWKQVWSLCLALWDQHLDEDCDPDTPSGERLLADHGAMSDWLEEVNSKACDGDGGGDMMNLLAANKIKEACMQCQADRNHIAATMLTQIKGDMNIRGLAYNQLATWRETSSDSHVPRWFLSVLMLCAGRACAVVDDKGELLHTCEGLTWIQALALHYWYLCEPVSTISDALAAFQRSFWEDSKRYPSSSASQEDQPMDEESEYKDLLYAEQVDIDKSRVAYPFPPYTSEARDECKKQMVDVRYQLMCLKASKWTSLDSIVNPASHTPDPLDYRLSWCLQQFLEGLGYHHWSQGGLSCLVTGFATQLEGHGLWMWAIFVLQHIANDRLRNKAVKDMLMRHAGSMEMPAIKKQLERLGLPNKWIHQAEAQLAHYRNDPESEAHHLTLAGRFVEAHQVILDKLTPGYILNENAEALRRVLQPLARPGEGGVIPHWRSGGHLFLEFMDIWDEVKSLVGLDWGEFSYKCEELKRRIASACTAISGLATPTLKHTVARWEVAARLAQVGCAVVGDPETGRVTKTSVRPLLSIIQSLDLPPDYTRIQLDKFIKSFTEEEVPC